MSENSVFFNNEDKPPIFRKLDQLQIKQKFENCKKSHRLVEAQTQQNTKSVGCSFCGVYYSLLNENISMNQIKPSQDHLFGFQLAMDTYRKQLNEVTTIINKLESGESFSLKEATLELYSFILNNNHLSIFETVELTQRSGNATITKK